MTCGLCEIKKINIQFSPKAFSIIFNLEQKFSMCAEYLNLKEKSKNKTCLSAEIVFFLFDIFVDTLVKYMKQFLSF